MKKYIIRNCHCFVEGIAIKGNVQKTQTCNNHKVRELTLCKDCTDCVMKQIVEKCKRTLSINKGFENEFTLGKITFAEFILKDIDIEDVE